MTDSTGLSNRRRRLIVVLLVLVVFGGGLWWFTRPRIDPRLVGTWMMSGSRHGLIFRGDGWFSKTAYVESTGYNARWRAEGDLIVISYSAAHPNPFERLLSELHYRWWRAAGGAMPMGYEHLQILDRAPDRLRAVYITMHGSESVMQLERASGPVDQ